VKGRSRQKKNPPTKKPQAWTFHCLEDEAGDSVLFKVLLGNPSLSKTEKNGAQQCCPISRHQSVRSSHWSWSYLFRRAPCSQTNMLSAPHLANYHLSTSHTYLMTATHRESPNLSVH